MTGSDGDRDLIDLSRTGQVVPPPDDAEVERAIASVPGVSSASLRRDPISGRTRLRLKLRAGEDAEQAAWSIAATLRERFGIALDPASIRPVTGGETGEPEPEAAAETPEAPATETPAGAAAASAAGTTGADGDEPAPGTREASSPGPGVSPPMASSPTVSPPSLVLTPPPPPRPLGGAPPVTDTPGDDDEPRDLESVPGRRPEPATATLGGSRATIQRLDIERGAREVQATVALLRGDQAAKGVARAVPTTRSILRAIAEATASALQQFMTAPVLIGIDRIEVEPAADPAHVLVAVTILADRGEEQLLGVSLVRGDAERAVVRATLNALNRRVSPFFGSPPDREAAAS